MGRWDIPDSWEWVKTEKIANIVGGGTPTSTDPENFDENGHPWLTPADLSGYEYTYIDKGKRNLSAKGLSSCGAKLMPPGTVLFSSRAPIGYCAIASNEICTNQGFKSLVLKSDIDPRFIRYYLLLSKDYAESLSSGSTFKELSAKRMKLLEFPIAPKHEQKRIADKIEALQAKSKKANQALEAAKPLLDKLRQSILASAFRGDLTADWRKYNPDVEPASVLLERIRAERRKKWEENELTKMRAKGKEPENDRWKERYKEPEPVDTNSLPKLPDGWCWVTAEEVSDRSLGKMLDRSKHREGKELPYIRNINVRWENVDTTDLLKMFFKNNELNRYQLEAGDVLICEGGEPGRAAVWDKKNDKMMYQKAIHRLRPYCNISPWWFVYHLWNDSSKGVLEKYYTGTTIKHFTGKSLSKYIMCLAPIKEIDEIVSLIKNSLAFINRIQNKIWQIEDQRRILDQSILSKAFKGELVPQNSL